MTAPAPISTQLRPVTLRPLGTRPLVSILIANYNYEQFIGEALDSALAQTYGHFEIVICDDGSIDGSMRVIESYALRDNRIRYAKKSNGGHGSALNRAFELCSGEIICLLDSDDLYRPEKVERVVSLFCREMQAGVGLHRVIRVNEKRRAQGVWPLYGELPEGWHGEQLLCSGGVLPYLPPTSGLSFRRQVAERLFPLPVNPPVGACPDQVLMRLAPMISRVCKLDEALAEYRVHSANTYTRNRVTDESVSREIAIGERLWAAQHDFLYRFHSGAASLLCPFDRSNYFLLLKYLQARLSGSSAQKQCYAAFIADVRRQSNIKHFLFWRSTWWMPRPVFAFVVNLLLGQSRLKQVLARLRGLL